MFLWKTLESLERIWNGGFVVRYTHRITIYALLVQFVAVTLADLVLSSF